MLDKENFDYIKGIEDLLKKATMLVNLLFEDKKDKGGYSYIGHLQFVSNKGTDNDRKIVGMLHDVIEDTVVSKTILLELGFPKYIVDSVEILTRKTDNYIEYIDSIIDSNNLIAIDVKMNDLSHNMDINRIANPTDEDYKRLDKYEKCYKKLERKKNELC